MVGHPKSRFRKAIKTEARLRAGLTGISGGGKTYTALEIAAAILETMPPLPKGRRIALLDSERNSALKFSGIFDFDHASIDPPYTPDNYIGGLKDAEAEGYDAIIVDSLSHAWAGAGGILEIVDRASTQAGGKFGGWKVATPAQNRLVDTILSLRAHVIVTVRQKTAWEIETNEYGKKAPKKIGTAPIQREGLEYEFDFFGELSSDHNLLVTKSRAHGVIGVGETYFPPHAVIGRKLGLWLADGAPVPVWTPKEIPPSPNEASNAARAAALVAQAKADGIVDITAGLRADYEHLREQLHEVMIKKFGQEEGQRRFDDVWNNKVRRQGGNKNPEEKYKAAIIRAQAEIDEETRQV